MSSELQKRIITSSVLISLLIIFNFSKFFIIGLFIAVLFICVEFSELLAKIVGPGLKKNSKSIKNLIILVIVREKKLKKILIFI